MRASSLFSILLSVSCAAGVLASHDAAAAAPHQALVRRQRSSSSGSSGGSSSSSGGSSSGKAAEPSSPGPNDVFRAGDQCTTQWSAASGNKWKKMTISLMTGTNQHMTKLEDIATDIDGTTQTSFSWTCPEVEPYSAIYFYQFTDSDGNNPTWCTRFTIASADGSTVPPPNAQQPEGDAIPWGEGKLVNGASSPSSSGSTSGSGQSSTNPSTSGSSGSSNNSSNSSSSAAPSSSSTSSRVTSNAAGSNSNSNSDSNSNTSSNSSTSGGSSGASSLQPVATSAVALMSVMIGAAILL